MQYIRPYASIIGVVAVFVLLNLVFFWIGPSEIIQTIGLSTAYSVTFAMAVFGGLSSLTGPSLYSLLVTFAAGGANPLFLGAIAGIGMAISDSVFFLLAQYGKQHVPPAWEPWVHKIEHYAKTVPQWVLLLGAFCYLAFLPLPNDPITIGLAVAGVSFRAVLLPLLLADITHATLLSLISANWL